MDTQTSAKKTSCKYQMSELEETNKEHIPTDEELREMLMKNDHAFRVATWEMRRMQKGVLKRKIVALLDELKRMKDTNAEHYNGNEGIELREDLEELCLNYFMWDGNFESSTFEE